MPASCNRSLLMAAVVSILLSLPCAEAAARFKLFNRGIDGSGDLEAREIACETFTEVVLDGAFDIHIEVGKSQRVVCTLDDNLFDNLETDVRGGALRLDWAKNCDPSKGCRIDITVPKLEAVTINGAGDIVITDYRGDEFDFRLNGAGDLEIAGQVDELNIKLAGAGNVDARDLIAQDVGVRISGAGKATVHAVDRIRGIVSGVGTITYYGDPEDEDTQVTGIGKIKKR